MRGHSSSMMKPVPRLEISSKYLVNSSYSS